MAKKYVYTATQNGWRGYFGFEQTIDFVNKKVVINWESGLHLANGATGTQTTPVVIKGLKFFVKTPTENRIEPHDESSLNHYTYNVSSDEIENEIWYSPFTVGEGTFSIKYDSLYQASLGISLVVFIKSGDNNWVECRNKDQEKYDNFILEPGCTEPTSPTFFKVTPNMALGKYIPGEDTTFTFDIRGAKNGVNNKIKEYRIFSQFSYGSTGGVSGFTIIIKPSGGSPDILKKDITLPRNLFDRRGATLTFSISSIGELSSSPTSPYYSSDSFYINRLPNTPTGKNLTILSNEDTGHIKVNPGTDLDNHPCTVYYKRKDATIYREYSNNTVLSPGTYDFKTYDGLEYSSTALQLSVTKNKKPVVDSAKVEIVKQGVSSRLTDGNTYIYAAELKIKNIQITGNWTSLSLKLASLSGQEINVQNFSSIKQLEDFIISPLKYLEAGNDNLTQYEIKIAANNIENGNPYSIQSITLGGVNKKFCLPPIPEYKGHANNNDSNDPIGKNNNYFYVETGLTFTYTYDSEYLLDISCNRPFEYGYLVENDADNKHFRVTIISELNDGTEYKFTPTIYSGINRKEGSPITLTTIKPPLITIARTDNTIIYPFTDEENFIISMNNFFQDESNERYGFSTEESVLKEQQIIGVFNLGGKQFRVSPNKIEKINDTITLTFSPDNIYTALDKVVKAGRYQASATIQLTNYFGAQYFIGVNPSFIVSYDSPPIINFTKEHILGNYKISIGEIALYRYKNSPTTEEPNIEKPFIEGETLSFTPSILGYTEKIKYVIQISRGNPKSWENFLSGEASLTEGNTPDRNVPGDYKIKVEKVVGEIFDNKNCLFKIIVYYGANNDKKESLEIGPFPRFRLTQPTFELLSSSVDGKNLAISYHLDNIGLDNIGNKDYPLVSSDSSLSLLLEELQNQPTTGAVTLIGSDDAINKWTTFINNEFKINTEIEESPNYETRLCTITCTVALEIGVHKGVTYSIKKKTSKTIRYYILQPTIAFRKNRIGINTTLIDNKTDAVMIVRAPSSEVRYIYFVPDDIVPNSSERAIVSWSDIPCIDLKDKTIKNFLIDGGTWS